MKRLFPYLSYTTGKSIGLTMSNKNNKWFASLDARLICVKFCNEIGILLLQTNPTKNDIVLYKDGFLPNPFLYSQRYHRWNWRSQLRDICFNFSSTTTTGKRQNIKWLALVLSWLAFWIKARNCFMEHHVGSVRF